MLTSGGDAPGMNAAIRSVVRTCIQYGVTPVGIHRGYNGLINSDVVELNARSVNGLTSRGGTMLYTARCPEFKTPEGVAKGVSACRYLGIDGLIAIGGDGTFRGAQDLANSGVNAVAIPGTIDNDIACSHYSIGFDTAANTAIDAIDKLADTMQSHERCSVVEVMGRGAGHLALYCGLACGAAAILIPKNRSTLKKTSSKKSGKGIITENITFSLSWRRASATQTRSPNGSASRRAWRRASRSSDISSAAAARARGTGSWPAGWGTMRSCGFWRENQTSSSATGIPSSATSRSTRR